MNKTKTLLGYTLLEMAIALAIIGFATGALYTTLTASYAVQTVSNTNNALDKIQSALDTYVAKNGYVPCPASRTAAVSSATYGVATDCTATAPTGTIDVGSGAAQIRIGVVPTRTLDLNDSDMLDGWDNRITYVVIKQLAQNSTSFTSYTNTAADSIIINDSSGNRINAPLADDNHVVYLLISHGRSGHGAYNSNGANFIACGSFVDSENCNSNNTFVDTNYNPNTAKLFDNIIRWKSRGQQALDGKILPGVTAASTCVIPFNPDAFLPTSVTSLKLWLDVSDLNTLYTDNACTVLNASHPNGQIACWKDKSGNGYNAKQGDSSSNKPKWTTSGLRFTNNYFFKVSGLPSGSIFPSLSLVSAMDVFIVMKNIATGGYVISYPTIGSISARIPWSDSKVYWQFNGSHTGDNIAWGGSLNKLYLWNLMSNYVLGASLNKVWRGDTNLINTTTTGPSVLAGTADFIIGCQDILGNNCFNGYISEVIVYGQMLTDDQRSQVNAYLKKKWGL
jgi:prepilin-type N-terminal cleavage/methylation domain-containing protein